MKTNLIPAVLGIFIFCTLSTNILGQNAASVDPEREVIVMFAKDALISPSGITKGKPDEFLISSQGLKEILQKSNVETISRLLPDFHSEDKYAINRAGRTVELTDWTNVYILRLPHTQAREKILEQLEGRPEIHYAEINGRVEPDLVPNDQYFYRQWALKNDGTSEQGSGTSGADIEVTQAWDITTGSSNIKIGIVDNGMQTNHPDFAGRVTGDAGDNSEHGLAVAGVAAAQGNNSSTGIAGVAWNVGIINEDYGNASDADVSAAVLSASNRGADVINNSWKLVPVGRYSETVRLAFADVYKLDRVAVVSMGNEYGQVIQYPAAFGKGIVTVGATTNTDVKADYSSTGSWIDVTAPGGGGFGPSNNQTSDYIYTTSPNSNYSWTFSDGYGIEGTSFAAPHVTGISALLFSLNSSLYNDDIEQIIRLSTDKVPDMQGQEFTTEYGTGRVNAYKALKLISSPNQVVRLGTYTGGTVASTGNTTTANLYGVPGISDGTYSVTRYEVIRDITFPQYMNPPSVPGMTFSLPQVWGNGTATTPSATGLPYYNGDCAACCNGDVDIFGLPHTEVVPGTVTNTGARLRTYVYKLKTLYYISGVCVPNTDLGYFPTSPANVQFAATVIGTTGVPKLAESAETSTPGDFSLEQNYPNPFNPTTVINYNLPKNDFVTLRVYDVLGREVAVLINENKEAGYYSVEFNASHLPSGVYFYKVTAGNFSEIRKMLLLK